MRHDVEHVDGVVGIQVAGSEVITAVSGVAFFKQVVDTLLQVTDVDVSVEIDIAHIVEEVGVEVRGFVLRIGIAALRYVAASTLPRAVARDGEIVGSIVVHRERTPVRLTLHADADVVGIGARIRIVEDDGGQRREESCFRHITQVNCCHDIGNGLIADVDVLQCFRQCRPYGREAILV